MSNVFLKAIEVRCFEYRVDGGGLDGVGGQLVDELCSMLNVVPVEKEPTTGWKSGSL